VGFLELLLSLGVGSYFFSSSIYTFFFSSVFYGGAFYFKIALGIAVSSNISVLTVLLRSFLSRSNLGRKFMVSPTPF
jgi:hypothetical protein